RRTGLPPLGSEGPGGDRDAGTGQAGRRGQPGVPLPQQRSHGPAGRLEDLLRLRRPALPGRDEAVTGQGPLQEGRFSLSTVSLVAGWRPALSANFLPLVTRWFLGVLTIGPRTFGQEPGNEREHQAAEQVPLGPAEELIHVGGGGNTRAVEGA